MGSATTRNAGRSRAIGLIAPFIAVLMLVSSFAVYASVPRPSEASLVPDAMPKKEMLAGPGTPPDPLSCVERLPIPAIYQAIDTSWSPEGSRLAYVRIVTSQSPRTVTGYEEDPDIAVLHIDSGTISHVGQGFKPQWSASGTFLSFWRAGHLLVTRDGRVVAMVDSSMPETRWVGEELVYFLHDQVRGWSEAGDRLISTVDADHMPRYPMDDAYFSADGALFLVTKYGQDGTTYRYTGETATGGVTFVAADAAAYTEWAPAGQTLLVRNPGSVELRDRHGAGTAAPLAAFPGPVHGWTADGKGLLMGAVSPTVPAGARFDPFVVWQNGVLGATATLPNLFGSRSFSPDGRFFSGVARAGLYDTVLEVYRCGTRLALASRRADPLARARQDRIESDGRRFVRPVAGYISQFLQGFHTGVDIAAPVGSVITAADEGVVNYVGWVPVGGRAVCVQHSGGLESCYYHTSIAYVTVGQHVARGQAVAAIGMSGLTTGPHVHWEAKQDGRIVDPLGR